MMRYLKILFLSTVVIGLIAGTAFAGATRSNHTASNVEFVASLEAMGAARNVTIAGSGFTSTTPPLTFVLGQSLVSGNLLEVTFSGAGFDGQSVNVCAYNGAGANATSIASATPTINATTYNFQTAFGASANVAAGNFVWFTNSTEIGCGAFNAGLNNLGVRLSSTPTATNPTVRVRNLTSGGIEVDTSTAANLAIIKAEYSQGRAASNHTIDYLGTVGNGTLIMNGVPPGAGTPRNTADSWVVLAGAANSLSINQAAGHHYYTNSGAANASLSVSAVVNLSDSANWQGVSKVYLTGGSNCVAANAVVTNTAPSGTVTLTIPATAATAANFFNGQAAKGFELCVEVDGTTALRARAIQGNVDVSVTGTGANDPAAGSLGNVQVWALNAYQAWVPWMVNASSVATYCLINNADLTRTASVILDVVSSEGGIVMNQQSLGTVAPMTSKLGTFTVDSASLTGGTAVSLTTLGANSRYAPRITATVSPNNASMTCVQTDPLTGVKRSVPVLEGTAGVWKQ